MTRPRNERGRFTVGEVGDGKGGQVSAGLTGNRVWINCLQGTGISVDLTAEDAETFALEVLELVEVARRHPANRDHR